MEAYKTLDTVLVKLFNDIMDIEELNIACHYMFSLF